MTISNKKRAFIVGVLILIAYSMLTYSITKNIALGVITDFISGIAVIGIPILMFPIFNTKGIQNINSAYIVSRFIEGILMIFGGVMILNTSLEKYRNFIYEHIHIYFFITGALFFYILLYRTQIVPKFISIWGIIATIMLLFITAAGLFGIGSPILKALVIPIVLNEFFLAIWLMVKGFNIKKEK